jgi:branched-chain amino acid transport system substrate-binding protein
MSLLDVGFAALRASRNPKDKAAVAQTLSKLSTPSMVGTVDFTKGPVPGVFATPIIGAQWVAAKPGGRFKLDCVVTEHATDPNVPVSAKLIPYS